MTSRRAVLGSGGLHAGEIASCELFRLQAQDGNLRLRSVGATAPLPLQELSTKRLLIARNAQSSKHSQRYVVPVERGLALCDDEGDRQPARKRTLAFA